MPYDRILARTDSSDPSNRGIGRAIELADRFGATVHALYVVDQADRAGDWDIVAEQQEAEGESALDAAAEGAAVADVETERHLRRGAPAEEIRGFVTEVDIDLIVMGTHGRSGINRIRHAGSTTERVIRRASIPVVAVPPGDP